MNNEMVNEYWIYAGRKIDALIEKITPKQASEKVN